METIKNYLTNMFMSLPNTPEVVRAKDELLSMMEDKYQELRDEGKSDNEAVGIVISEFGNLEELAESLGIADQMTEEKRDTRPVLPMEKAKEYIEIQGQKGNLVSFGVFLCITSVLSPIIFGISDLDLIVNFGIAGMFIMIAVAVILFIIAGSKGDFKEIEKKTVVLDVETTEYVRNEKARYSSSHVIMLAIGVGLCICSILPPILFSIGNLEDLGAGLMFVFVGVGVLLIVASSYKQGAYDNLLKLNSSKTMAERIMTEEEKKANTIIGNIESVYWQTVLALFLIIGFLTFDWSSAAGIWIWGVIGKIALGICGKLLGREED
ncbi:MAG: permease prefix domain 1-containing protein [Pseudobutyrivibrio sp.]|nr:permease prefix domain 1-containing protein [Pseudobutyrivibrio sp.]